MKVDSAAEAAMRTAIHAAVKRDFGKLDENLRGFGDDETVRAVMELALTVIGFLMIDIHQGVPDDRQVSAVASAIAEQEQWAEPTYDEVNAFLSRLMRGEPFGGVVPAENVFVLAFVVAGNLLSSCRRDDEKWWDYLDRIEDAIEAAG